MCSQEGFATDNEKGLTLIELVIALAVMAIVSHTAALSFSLADRQSLNQACVRLKSDLRYAQRLAIAENRKYYVGFDVVGNKYTVYYMENVKMKIVKVVDLGETVRLRSTTNPRNQVAYTSAGATGDPCTIALRNDAYWAELTVNLGVGRVKLTTFKRL